MIVFYPPENGTRLVKRVIGLPGDTVELQDERVPHRPAMRTVGPSVVPPGHYLVMGDSRDNSKDSRFIGPVPRENILGCVPRVMLSLDPSRDYLPRIRRILQPMTLAKS